MPSAPPTASASPSGLLGALVARPVGVLMVVASVVVFGAVAYRRLPVTLMPDISYPRLTVRTEFAGAAPEEVENLVARPLEEALGVLAGLVNISSVSRAGLCDVVLEFAWDTPMNTAAQEVREKLDQAELPRDAGRPLVLRYDPALDPVVRLGLYGPTEPRALRRLADGDLKRELESVRGVAAVRVRGGDAEEIHVALEERALAARGLSITAIKDRLGQENVNLASGTLREGQVEYLVRTLNEFKSTAEIADLVVARQGDAEVRVRDLGRVFSAAKRREVATRLNGAPSIEIELHKEADANLVAVADAVQARVYGEPPTVFSFAGWFSGWGGSGGGAGAKAGEKGAREAKSGAAAKGTGAAGAANPALQRDGAVPLADTLPAGCRVEVLSDQSTFVRAAIADVQKAALSGALLAVLVLLPFLRRVRDTLLIGVAIPLSVVATFGLLHLFHVSLNVMSLGGLALGVGMLVDAAIVVLESIARRRDAGEPPALAAELGTREVGLAVSASVLTTVAVFLPIVFVEGVAGQVFRDQAITVVFALFASLAVADLVVPVLAARELELGGAGGERWTAALGRWSSVADLGAAWRARIGGGARGYLLLAWTALRFPIALAGDLLLLLLTLLFWALLLLCKLLCGLVGGLLRGATAPLAWLTDRALALFSALYPSVLRVGYRARALLFAGCAALLVASFSLLPQLGRQLLPEVHQGEFTLRIALPVGSLLAETEAVVRRIETAALAGEDRVATLAATLGAEKDSDHAFDDGEHTARLTFRLRPGVDPVRGEAELMARLRRIVGEIPGIVGCEFSRPVLFTFRAPVEVEIRTHELPELKRLARAVAGALAALPGLADVRASIGEGNPELAIFYDRERLAQARLSVAEVAAAVKNKVQGEIATRFVERERRIDVRVKVRDEDVGSLQGLRDLLVTPAGGKPLPLSALAEIRKEEGPSEIRRIGHQRAATVTANLVSFDLGGVLERIGGALRTIERPPECAFLLSGQNQEMELSLTSLKMALALAAFLVYVVMASQFESLLQPLLILFTLPLAFVGVVPVLYWTGTPVSVLVFIGAIVLAGVVVDNAIVLVDGVNQLRAAGRSPLEAVIEGGRTRIRPILMTTLTTMVGLAPMALDPGAGAEIQRPLALTVIAGLASSTLLTLVVIPVIYLMAARDPRAGPP